MSFGLTHAPSMFQNLMNDMLKIYLHRFMLIFFFFYDILIYNKDLIAHVERLTQVLQILSDNELKINKCTFGQRSLE